MDMVGKKEKVRKELEDHCKELMETKRKLAKQVSGQASLQGEKHLISDVMITEFDKL